MRFRVSQGTLLIRVHVYAYGNIRTQNKVEDTPISLWVFASMRVYKSSLRALSDSLKYLYALYIPYFAFNGCRVRNFPSLLDSSTISRCNNPIVDVSRILSKRSGTMFNVFRPGLFFVRRGRGFSENQRDTG